MRIHSFYLVFSLFIFCIYCVESDGSGVSLLSTPWVAFTNDSNDIEPNMVQSQAMMHKAQGVTHVWVNGVLGEFEQLTIFERKTLAEQWVKEGHSQDLFVIVHVGHWTLRESKELALHAESIGADGIGLTPLFSPRATDLDGLIDRISWITKNNSLPFYYHHNPNITGYMYNVSYMMESSRDEIPNWRGVWYGDDDLDDFDQCLEMNCTSCTNDSDGLEMFWQNEPKSQAISHGITSYALTENYYGPIVRDMLHAYSNGDANITSLEEKYQRIQDAVSLGSPKDVMGFLGLPLGPMRYPMEGASQEDREEQRNALDAIGFFDGQPHVSLPTDTSPSTTPSIDDGWVTFGTIVGVVMALALIIAVPTSAVMLWRSKRLHRSGETISDDIYSWD